MNHTRVLLTLMSLLASTAVAQDHGLNEKDLSAVKSEVTAFLQNYKKTIEGGNETAIRRLYVSDARFSWFTDGRKAYATPDDILKSLAGLSASGIVLRTEHARIHTTPFTRNLAFVSMAFKTKATVKKGKGFSYAGVITMLLERSTKGAWRVVHGHTSTPKSSVPRGSSKHHR